MFSCFHRFFACSAINSCPNISKLSGPLRLRVQSRSRTWLRIAASIAFLFGACFQEVLSEAWGPPQFQEKRSRSEKAILGALGEFRGILGAALGIGNSILGIRNSILGMASHDLSNTKPTILGATLGAIPGIAANPPERFSFAPAFSERFFKNWGGPRAPDFRHYSTTIARLSLVSGLERGGRELLPGWVGMRDRGEIGPPNRTPYRRGGSYSGRGGQAEIVRHSTG